MKRPLLAALLICLIALTSANLTAQNLLPLPDTTLMTNEWAVYLTADADPDALAAQLGMVNLGQVGNLTGIYRFVAVDTGIRAARADITTALNASPQIFQAVQQTALVRETRGVEDNITDPTFPSQWHLKNNGTGGGTLGADANVYPAWNLGYTGTGIVVSSVDNGVWHTNPDIAPNYRADLSWDYQSNDSDPSGGGHGTSVAGVMAADNDGTKCGVGVAFNAQISGVRLLGGSVTDAMEADAVSHRNDAIHIYNNSWGPSDTGTILEAPGPLTLAALEDNITTGRGGLGAITVWAAGNGKLGGDNVNADGYANLRSVIAVSATSNTGVNPWYSEPGSPILINAPSDGGTAGIVTTGGSASACTSAFGGTSSAAPLVAGVVALMLEANPNLTWRDVQHILVETAMKNDPTHSDWATNAAGYDINHYYGFGRVDAGAAVALADTWVNVDSEISLTSPVQPVNQTILDGPSGPWQTSTITVADSYKLEHVEVILNINHLYRGQLEIELISPEGTTSRLMFGRGSDSGDHFANWRMSSVRHWGEDSAGTWTLRVRDLVSGTIGTLNDWQLKIYGTELAPRIVDSNIPTEILIGDTATLSITASNPTGLNYQWYQGLTGDTATPIGTNAPNLTTDALAVTTDYWIRLDNGEFVVDSPTYTINVVDSFSLIGTTGWDNGSLLPFYTMSPSNDKLVCTKLSNTPPCAFRFIGSATEKGKLGYDLIMAGRHFTPKTTNEWRISGMYNANATTSLVIAFQYDFIDPSATDVKFNLKLTPTVGWQPFQLIVPIPRTDINTMKIRIRNLTKTGKRIWLDDLDVRYGVGSANRPSADGTLELPPAPDGFRGGN